MLVSAQLQRACNIIVIRGVAIMLIDVVQGLVVAFCGHRCHHCYCTAALVALLYPPLLCWRRQQHCTGVVAVIVQASLG